MNHHVNDKNHRKSAPGSFAEIYRELSPYLNLSYTLLASILLFTFLGKLADDHWHLRPWGTVSGALLGITVGMYHFLKVVLAKPDNQDKSS